MDSGIPAAESLALASVGMAARSHEDPVQRVAAPLHAEGDVRWRATISVIVAAVMIAALRRAGRAAQVDPITSMRVENQHSTDR